MIAFEKMHGNGNDFVVIDALTSNIVFSKALVKRIAHRKLGVGCDQLIAIYPPKKKQDDFFIKFFNASSVCVLEIEILLAILKEIILFHNNCPLI